MNMEEQGQAALLPCPFCGGSVELERASDTYSEIYGDRKWWGVVCRNTANRGGSCAIQQIPSASEEAAIARWNRRAALAVPPAEPPLPSSWDEKALEVAYVLVHALIYEIPNDRSNDSRRVSTAQVTILDAMKWVRAEPPKQAEPVTMLTEALESFDERLTQWAGAYPLSVFPEPDFGVVADLLQQNGLTLDSVSASNMRHVVTTLNELFEPVRAALNGRRKADAGVAPTPAPFTAKQEAVRRLRSAIEKNKTRVGFAYTTELRAIADLLDADGVNPSARGHEWTALAAAENALNSIDGQIDLSQYWCAPDNTLLDLTKEALRLCKKARAASGVGAIDHHTVAPTVALPAQPEQSDRETTAEYTLRAMCKNYKVGHMWDELDADACLKAADAIHSLSQRLKESKA